MMEILEIKNVSYSYANSKEKILSGVNQKFELGKVSRKKKEGSARI